MEVCRRSSWLLLLLGVSLLATTLQGVQGEAESEGPSESECRPYIEKALKELETGETSNTGTTETTDSKEDVPTVEITTDDSEHPEGEGEDDIHEEGHESTESVESDQNVPDEQQSEQEDTPEEPTAETETETDEDTDTTQEEQDNQEAEEGASTESDDQKAEEVSEEKEGDEQAETETESKEQSTEAETKSTEAEDTQESVEDKDSKEATEQKEGADTTEDTDEETGEGSVETEQQQEASQETQEESKEGDEVAEESGEAREEGGETAEESGEAAEKSAEAAEESAEAAGESAEVAEEGGEAAEESAEGEQVEATETGQDESAEGEQEESAEGEQGESVEEQGSREEQGEGPESDDNETKEDDKEETKEDDKSEDKEDDKSGEAAEDDKSETKDDDSQQGTSDEPEGGSTEAEAAGETDEKSAEQDDSTPDATKQEESKEDETEEVKQDESQEDSVSKEGETQSEEGEDSDADKKSDEEDESVPEEELSLDIEIPTELRERKHVEHLLKLDDEASETEKILNRVAEITLRELKKLYENAIKPLEVLYKYRDLSNRHFGDSEIFSKPLILFMGPWSGGKSSIINYLLDNEYNETALRTGAEPSPAYFNILMYGEEPEILDGTQLAADFTFSGLQKFGQGLEERLRGVKLPSELLDKVNIVEIPGILEVRKQVSRVFPFNDACQWFIDRADIIFLVYDPSKLDVGPETEAILDQLKGREHQTRIILNKADQVKPEELMRVQGALIWNISPLMSSAQPPVMYTTSLWSRPYEPWAPVRLLQAQERAFLRDLRSAVDKRIENKIASARRFAVRVRNHAKMVDCYLTTYYNHKSVFGNRKQVADEIIEHPQDYHIYEGLSTLTNISRYDLPDPDVYRDFFKLNPLYDFQQLSATCTYFRGCPINRLDVAIAYDLPELVGKHKRLVESALAEANQTPVPGS